jgi:hypothetical protein
MNTLWAFGCSITDLYDSETSLSHWSKSYIEWKGYVPKNYSELMAEKLECKLKNFGVSSADNYTIFQNFCDNINNIQQNDYVIIQWTQTSRFRLVSDDGKWTHFVTHYNQNKRKLENLKQVSSATIQETLINRTHDKFYEEIVSWENVIHNLIKPDKLLIWKPFEFFGLGQMVKSVENVKTETNGLVDDLHFSEAGQIKMSEILLDRLQHNKKNIL